LAEWPDGYVHANGLDIYYHRTGGAAEGKPSLILLHGLTDNGLCWTRVARDLQAEYHVIMPDARGHGRTGGPLEDVSVSLLADDVVAFMDALGLDQPFLFGHSMGAITAMYLAAEYPDAVGAIVLEDPPLLDGPRTEDEMQVRTESANANEARTREELMAQVRAENPGWADEEIGPWADSKLEFDPGVMALAFDLPWREVVSRITCPFLLLAAEPDRGALVTPEQTDHGLQLSQRGEAERITGAGHSIHRDRYPETMQAVRQFLAKHSD
jgi:N-formylmaleamate deformylase